MAVIVCCVGDTQLQVGDNLNYLNLRFNPYSSGIDYSQTKVDPRTVRVKIFLLAVTP